MSLPNGINGSHPRPVILLLGEIVLAHDDWDALRAIAELRVCFSWSRDCFLEAVKADRLLSNSVGAAEINSCGIVQRATLMALLPFLGPGILRR